MTRPDGEGISIICVYNDVDVRADCLDRSVDALGEPSGGIEYIPVDNTGHRFTSAGAALNHGAESARYDVLVFVHQDVFLHSLDRLERAAHLLRSGEWGLLGAAGITGDGTVIGRMRDRLILIGADADVPAEVDSLDEVLFMVRRDQILHEPLSQAPDLAWHAYAVEYGLRLRRSGLKVGAMNLAVTHNSLTINLARLDEAHRFLARVYTAETPVATTCGTIADEPRRSISLPALQRHRWRYRWLRESVPAWKARRHLPGVTPVLSDIRIDIDDVSLAGPLRVFNFDGVGGFDPGPTEPVTLLRRGRPVEFRTVRSQDDLVAADRDVEPGAPVLVTNLAIDHLRTAGEALGWPSPSVRVGFHESGGFWALRAPATAPTTWAAPRAVPLGMRHKPAAV